jgi:hypothetical protein
MSEIHIPELFAPAGGWRVRILDLSGGAEEGIVEDIAGFPTLMQANEFARRYVRDSIELCRKSGGDVLATWRMFGEDAHVIDAGEDTWRAEPELFNFAERPASPSERDWRALDPRGDAADEDDGEGDDE